MRKATEVWTVAHSLRFLKEWYRETEMVINTDADVIRVIRQNPRLIFQALNEDPELLADVRRAILTDELLSLPTQFAEMKAAQDEMLETQNKMLATQNKILADLSETRRVQAEMLATQDEMLAELADLRRVQAGLLETQAGLLETQAGLLETQNRILDDQNRMSGRMGNLEGAELERKIFRILPGRLYPRYGLHRPRILLHPITETRHTEEFTDTIADANEDGTITDSQYNRLINTDMILRARQRESGETVYCAVEASSVIDNNDVTRAAESSQALHAVYGSRTIPVVAGYRITDEATEMADSLEVSVTILDRPYY